MKPRSTGWNTATSSSILILCPVKLYNATGSTETVSFNRINKATGNRIVQKVFDAVTDEPVESAAIVTGTEVAPGKFVPVTDAEIAAWAPKSAYVPEDDGIPEELGVIEIGEFVKPSMIPLPYYEDFQFMAPAGEAAHAAFAVIREAIAKEKVAALAQLTSYRSREERLVALAPCGVGLSVAKLRYAGEVRDLSDAFTDVADRSSLTELVAMARELVHAGTVDAFTPESYHDRFDAGLRKLVTTKIAGGMVKPSGRATPKMASLSDAVRKSVEQMRARAPAKTRA